MKRPVKAIIAASALALTLAFPVGAGANTKWICTVDGVPTVFVSAGDAAIHGLTQADATAGTVFETQFGEENCHIESGP
jgi:hypothetical protein